MICVLAFLAVSGFVGGLMVDLVKAKVYFRDNIWPWLRK